MNEHKFKKENKYDILYVYFCVCLHAVVSEFICINWLFLESFFLYSTLNVHS